MKAIILILVLILVKVSSAVACEGIGSEAMQALVASAKSMKKYVVGDANFSKIRATVPVKIQKKLNEAGMEPIDFSDPKHHLDYQVLGDIEVDTFDDKGNKGTAIGSAVKIGKSCIITSAHTLYQSMKQEMSEDNQGSFDKTIKFNRGHGKDAKSFTASVFFQMTKPGIDYVAKEGKRLFHGHNDLVVLKLNNHSDNYFRKISVMKPEQVVNNSNPQLGKEMMCQGSPYYKTSKTYGSCKGSDYRWKQENARVFEDDLSDEKGGMSTNVASGPGMSGGPCYLNDNPNEVFALVSNGFHGTETSPTLPNLEFGGNYAGGNARYVSLFHVLDERMKSELGYGLDEISEKCK